MPHLYKDSPPLACQGTYEERSLGFRWYRFPMEAVIDQAGRIVLPKPIRDALGLLPGTKVDISPYGAGAQVVPAGRTARLVEEDGVLVWPATPRLMMESSSPSLTLAASDDRGRHQRRHPAGRPFPP